MMNFSNATINGFHKSHLIARLIQKKITLIQNDQLNGYSVRNRMMNLLNVLMNGLKINHMRVRVIKKKVNCQIVQRDLMNLCNAMMIGLDSPENCQAYREKFKWLQISKRSDEALNCYDDLIRQKSDNHQVFRDKIQLQSLKRYEQSLQFCDEWITEAEQQSSLH